MIRPARQLSAGFSLLEVVLALAILTGAIAVLGELARSGMHSARLARDLTQAQLLCESKLAEITAGIEVLEPARSVPFEFDPEWLYSLEIQPLDQEGLLAVTVTVEQDLPSLSRPVRFSLLAWVPDPQEP